MPKNVSSLLLLLTCFGLWPLAAGAEQSATVGDYVVHYNALTTDMLQPEVARHYGITRSKSQALLNVSVQKKVMGTTGKPVTASVEAHATNLNNQLKNIAMREVEDQGAIYYLGTVRVDHGETLNFSIDVTPEGKGQPLTVEFQQRFFTE